ncbi:MAG: 3-methyladenine DNA glycosylase [Ignavibacteria bacterium 13_1_40CM_2_61_4]|nr:MAG: 3-methyladenine DNA glycosylase [Ignavibacteria bacterium 13_1_40CM_2_61_4]
MPSRFRRRTTRRGQSTGFRSSKLPRSFYLRPTLKVAKDLLGKYLVRRIGSKSLVGKIVEVEAYLGELDPASHAYRGMTKRNEVMFRTGGHLYVYFTYGMHFCCNVVTEQKGKGRAVLLRAVEPVGGLDLMEKNRRSEFSELTNGPAKLCQAFGIKRNQNGTDLLAGLIFLVRGERIPRSGIASGPRIGIKNGREKKWRFYIRGNAFVSG